MAGWRTIGVIGGMGPAATADFLQRLVAVTNAGCDADHPRILVDSNPQVPDRNAALAGQGASPGPVLAAMAQGLAAAGAQVLAMPCNAAHGWATEIAAATDARFINMIDAAVAAAAVTGARRIGILAIGATLDAGLYQRRLADAGIAIDAPDRAAFQQVIDRIKAGDTGAAVRAAMAGEAARLVAGGADAIIAACTEVPLVFGAADAAVPVIDATAALVSATLAAARVG